MAKSNYATKQDVEDIVNRVVNGVVSENNKLLMDYMDERFQTIDERFDVVYKRFDIIDRRFEAVDKRFDQIESRLNAISDVIGHHTIDIKELQSKLAAA